MTDVQLQILKEKFPGIGEPTLRRNAAALLGHAAPVIHVAVPNPTEPPPVAEKRRKSKATGLPKAPKPRAHRVARTRNAGTLTESGYWGFVRSTLRRAFRFWKPAVKALHAVRVPMAGARGRKWGYVCAACGKVYLRTQVQIDHKEPAGALTEYAHVGDFLRRLTPEDPAAYQVLCTGDGTQRCHEAKTASDRER